MTRRELIFFWLGLAAGTFVVPFLSSIYLEWWRLWRQRRMLRAISRSGIPYKAEHVDKTEGKQT
jgi:hypothetical protein